MVRKRDKVLRRLTRGSVARALLAWSQRTSLFVHQRLVLHKVCGVHVLVLMVM